ncbi:MAG: Asp-tRNA(Asn)/Glu-tRNA(Gln) amidotransferase subunit GatC [Woeseiaceae bacterium]
MSLTKEQVQHIALLARLQLDDDEFDEAVDKLSRIVDFVAQLQSAPTENVLPMAHPVDQPQRLRRDAVTENIDRQAIQAHAPAVQDGFYLVPKVIE